MHLASADHPAFLWQPAAALHLTRSLQSGGTVRRDLSAVRYSWLCRLTYFNNDCFTFWAFIICNSRNIPGGKTFSY
jgi:hypothetical protein